MTNNAATHSEHPSTAIASQPPPRLGAAGFFAKENRHSPPPRSGQYLADVSVIAKNYDASALMLLATLNVIFLPSIGDSHWL